MNLAHLILAHNNPIQLERLINRLSHPDADIYIHLDKKTQIGPFLHLKANGKVFFIKNRVKVYWGSFNIVQATLNGLNEIAASGKSYHYINLLSGQDYPLKSQEYIHQYLGQNQGKAFMKFLSFDPDWLEAIPRIRDYHFNNLRIPGRYKIQEITNKILSARKLPYNLVPVGRSQWFTISMDCVGYILDFWKTHGKFRRFIKLTWAPDEFMFQTILYNSVHNADMINDDLRYIDWSAGGVSPKTLTTGDTDALIKSGKFFARKFDINKDAAVLNYLDKVIDSEV